MSGTRQTRSEPQPNEIRSSVTGNNQIRLPSVLVKEIGYQAPPMYPNIGPRVAWYYHEPDEKAVLANDKIERQSLELRATTRLSGVSERDLQSGNPPGANVTITNRLPDRLHEMLCGDNVVLKPVYQSNHASLDNTVISVYPAREYDRGDLPNVGYERIPKGGRELDESNRVGNKDTHANSV